MKVSESVNKKVSSKITVDLLYTIGAQIVLNIVTQLVIYPFINKHSGEAFLGNIVFYMEIIYILSLGFGNAMCSIRLTTLNKFKTTNYDYNKLLQYILPITAIVAMGIMYVYDKNWINIITFGLLSVFTVVRYYVCVEYRIHLNFKMYFYFFVILSAGYCLGFLFYIITDIWTLIFLTGEVLIVGFMFLKTGILKNDRKSGNFGILLKNISMLTVSYLGTELLSNLDRLILKTIVDSRAVSIYYVVSLIGKTMLIFSIPINNLLLSYISTDKNEFTWKQFKKMLLPLIIIDIAFYACCAIATPIFVKIFYPNLISQINGLNLIVNAAQIITFTATMIIIVILATVGAKYHLILQIIYAVALLPLSIILTRQYGIWGYAVAALISNSIRVGSILFVARKKMKYE